MKHVSCIRCGVSFDETELEDGDFCPNDDGILVDSTNFDFEVRAIRELQEQS